MDSKNVNREIRSRIWPALRKAGFSVFSSRTAWRYGEAQIDVLNFQSFNRYNAGIIGVTTFSFCVNLGCYLTYLPPQWPIKLKKARPIPRESECQFRARLTPSIAQVVSKQGHQNQIWAVDEEGLSLAWCIGDVEQQVPLALAWCARLSNKEEVLKILLDETERMSDLWGFGNNPSPWRSYLAGYTALTLGKGELARQKLGEAVGSGCFEHLFKTVEGAINRVA
jgi:Domain of unknown function (DUF4304)